MDSYLFSILQGLAYHQTMLLKLLCQPNHVISQVLLKVSVAGKKLKDIKQKNMWNNRYY